MFAIKTSQQRNGKVSYPFVIGLFLFGFWTLRMFSDEETQKNYINDSDSKTKVTLGTTTFSYNKGTILTAEDAAEEVARTIALGELATLTLTSIPTSEVTSGNDPLTDIPTPSPITTEDLIRRQRQRGGGPLVRETMVIEGKDIDILWQGTETGKIRGILWVGHGCSHSHTDFWSADPTTCPDCLGLPEERAIVQLALEYEFVVVATSSQNRGSKCWSPEDFPIVSQVLVTLQRRWGNVVSSSSCLLDSSNQTISSNFPPILAFGASSGGGFVETHLARHLEQHGSRLDVILGQIAARPLDIDSLQDKTKPSCIFYLTMNRDEFTDANAVSIVSTLQSHPSSESQQSTNVSRTVKHIRLPPLLLANDFFSIRIGEDVYSIDDSKVMVGVLRENNFLDQDGYLLQDPRQSDWRKILEPYAKGGDTLTADKSALSEVLNAAFGMHEMSRDGIREALDICRQQSWTHSLMVDLFQNVFQIVS
jgi:hypothetical protein